MSDYIYNAYGTVRPVEVLRHFGSLVMIRTIDGDGDVYVCLPHELREVKRAKVL